MRLFFWLLFLTPSIALAESPTRVLVVGDSIAAGWNLEAGALPFPDLLQKTFKESNLPVIVINAGYNGDTIGDGLGRIPAYLAQHHPTHVVIALGVNDMWRALPLAQAETNLQAAVDLIRKAGAKPILFGVGPFPGMKWPHAREFPELFRRVAEKNHVPLLPEYLKPALGNPKLNQPDRIHLNGAGQKIISKRCFRFLLRNL